MVKKGRRRIVTIPRAEELVNVKKDDLLPKEKTEEEKLEELRKAEELQKKEKEERLKRLQEFKEYEKQKLESIKKDKEDKYDPYEKNPKIKYENNEEQPILYGDFLNDISTDPENEDGVVIKTYDENVTQKSQSEFTYKAEDSDFQKSLKDFFTDIPATFDFEEQEIKQNRIEKIEFEINKLEKAETITTFNNQIKDLMSERNRNVTPQSYKKEKENMAVFNKNTNYTNIENKILPNRNMKISSRRNNQPVSRTGNKVSSNRTIL